MSAVYIQVHFRLDFFMEASGSSLIWVHIAFNIGYLNEHYKADVDGKSCDWHSRGEIL